MKPALPVLLLMVVACQNHPPSAPIVNGTTRCRPGDTARFQAVAVDPEEDSLNYDFSWGDGLGSGWSGWLPHGVEYPAEHVFAETGSYSVLCRSRDGKHESGWSDSLPVLVRHYIPFVPPRPSGPETLTVSDSAWFATTASHPLERRVSVEFDWGDSSGTRTGYHPSSSVFWAAHVFTASGRYEVRARAIDSLEYASGWSAPESVLVLDSFR